MYEFEPITRRVSIEQISAGSVVMSGPHEPAIVTSKNGKQPAVLSGLFTWQNGRGNPFRIGQFYPGETVEVPLMDTRQFNTKEKS